MKEMCNINELIKLCENLKVLYVEDDEKLNEVNNSILNSIFKKVDAYTNSKKAFEKYEEENNCNQTYDLVISDINMPYMSGIELSKEILKINKKQMILIISAYNDSEKLESLIELGIKYFIQKPVSTDKFFEVLEKTAKEIHEKIDLEKAHLQLSEIDNITKLKNIHALHKDIKEINHKNLLIIELTNLENIQSIYGIDKSDEILKELIDTIKNKITEKNSLYRKGTNKFAYLFSQDLDKEKNNLIEKLDESIFSYSIGASCEQQENLISTAKMALKYAKNHNQKYKIYTKEIDTKDNDLVNLKIKEVISMAIKENSVFPVYQPIYNRNKEIIKYEILMRIKSNAEDKIYYPNEFIDIAISINEFDRLNFLMLEKVFKVMERCDKKFSFNISYEDILSKTFCDYLEEKFKEDESLGKRFVFELLETYEIEDYAIIDKFIKRFRKYGVSIALDDFGTGYSNLSQIINMDFDYVKIDGSLIKEINYNYKSFAIVKAVITFAKETNIKTVAEFVLSESIYEKLLKIGIDEFQGYYLSKPLEEI